MEFEQRRTSERCGRPVSVLWPRFLCTSQGVACDVSPHVRRGMPQAILLQLHEEEQHPEGEEVPQ